MFALQFDPKQISYWADRYDAQGDEAALKAGQRIAAGEYLASHLQTIFDWKTNGRGKSRLGRNTSAEITDALRLATLAKTDRSAISVLLGLRGVAVPVASAILTAIDPARFTVIDFRALRSLGYEIRQVEIDATIGALSFCRELASSNGVCLRTVDRALWQHDKEREGPLSELQSGRRVMMTSKRTYHDKFAAVFRRMPAAHSPPARLKSCFAIKCLKAAFSRTTMRMEIRVRAGAPVPTAASSIG